MILPRKTDVEYEVVHRGDHLFILLRDPERPNSELLVAPVSDPTKTSVSSHLATLTYTRMLFQASTSTTWPCMRCLVVL